MDTLPNDVFATIYSEGEGAGGWSPFPQNSIHPFDTSSLTPTTSEISSSSSMDLSSPNQDIFRTPSSELTPSPLDLTSCDEDLFSRQLLSTVLNPATTLHPMKTCTSSLLGSIPQQKSPKLELGLFDLCSQSFADLILAPSSMVVATTIENATVHSNISAPTMKRREATAIPLLFSTSPSVAPTTTMTTTTTTMTTAATATASIPSSIPCSTLSSLSLSPVFCSSSSQDVEMIEVKIEPIKDTPRAKKINADREKPITEKRLTKMPGIAKRHSVSRQAQQPPLVTHQHHTPPPFVSPLIQRPHHQQQHYHQKSGSLDLRRANLNCFIQPQRQVEPSAQHEHIPSVGLLTMHLQDSTSTSLGADTLSSTPVGKQSPSDLCQSRLHQIPQSPSKQQQQQLLPHQQHQSSQQEALESLELQLRQQQRQHHRQQQGQLQQLQLHQREQRQTSMLFGSGATNTTGGSQRMSSMLKRRLTRDKLIKNDREEVWPADVERVFYEALEVVPKLGRRKVLVDGKPCGRNELIADYIYKRTNKIRTRKQVSSHIQVLKNTRKSDVAFMKLLMDSGDGEDDLAIDITNGCLSTCGSPEPSPTTPTTPLAPTAHDVLSQRRNSTTAIPSYGFQLHQHLASPQTRQLPRRHRHSQSMSSIMSDVLSSPVLGQPMNQQLMSHSAYRNNSSVLDSVVSLAADSWKSRSSPACGTMVSASSSSSDDNASETMTTTTTVKTNLSSAFGREGSTMSDLVNDIAYPFWPSVFGLYTEYISDLTPDIAQMHSLARSSDLGQKSFGSINVHQLPQGKFPTLYDLYQKTMCTFLYFKIKLDLNLSLNGVFGNSSMFDSTERRLVECTTSIYSFGTKVLEAKELQQAAVIDNKCVYNFEFVNQFFGAFLNGIRSLTTWGEIEIALKNLSVVQVFEDKDSRFESPAPLLVMAFDFERGQGDVETFFIADGSDMLETTVC